MDIRFLSRRRVLIKPAYQLKLALTLFIYVAVYSIILAFIIFYPLYTELASIANVERQAVISEMVLYLHKRVWPGLFLVAFLAAVHGIFSSHRMVGPAYRFEKMLEELVRGNYSHRIKIRKRDDFKEIETLLNRLAEKIEMSRRRNAAAHADFRTKLETISAMLEAEGAVYPSEVKRLIRELVSEIGTVTRAES